MPPLLLSLLWAAFTVSAGQEQIDPTSYIQSISAPALNPAEAWKNFQKAANHEEIVASAPDTWAIMPTELDGKYRNPCWTDRDNRFRCMPFFQILGVSKCGTTDLFARLRQHPEVAYGSKGPHFWDECHSPPNGPCTAPPHGDFDSYVNLFEKGAYQIATSPSMITGEASSNTFTGVYAFVRGLAVRKKVNITLAELIHEAQPYQRMIVLMRDPIARYYSAFHYYRSRSSDPFEPPEKFHARVVKDIGTWKYCSNKYGKMYCLKRYNPQQLIKGMYSEYFDAWMKVFPRENFLFFRTEDYKAATKEHLQAVMSFLGLRNLREDELARIITAKRSNEQSSRYPDMLPETRALLEEFYAPFNQRLSELMGGDKRFLWKDFPVEISRNGT